MAFGPFGYFSRGLGLFAVKANPVTDCPDRLADCPAHPERCDSCPYPGGPVVDDRPTPAEACCDCDDDECDAPEPNYAERERQRHAELMRAHLQRVGRCLMASIAENRPIVKPVESGGVSAREAALAKALAKCISHWAGDNGLSLPHAIGLLSMAKTRIESHANRVAQVL